MTCSYWFGLYVRLGLKKIWRALYNNNDNIISAASLAIQFQQSRINDERIISPIPPSLPTLALQFHLHRVLVYKTTSLACTAPI